MYLENRLYSSIQKQYPVLNAETERKLLTSYLVDGDLSAREELVYSNFGLVRSIVSKFNGDFQGIDADDMFQEGVLGLMHAMDKFDLSKGKLSTYATPHISVYIQRCVENCGRNIRLPVHVYEKAQQCRRAADRLEVENKEVTVENISKLTGLSEAQVKEALHFPDAPTSLDQPMGEDSNATMMDMMCSNIATPEERMETEAENERIRDAASTLSRKEQEYFTLRYVDDMPARIVQKKMGLSREEVKRYEGRIKIAFAYLKQRA